MKGQLQAPGPAKATLQIAPMRSLAIGALGFLPRGSTSTQYLRPLVPKTIPLMVLGTRDLKYRVLGPFGLERFSRMLEPACHKPAFGILGENRE